MNEDVIKDLCEQARAQFEATRDIFVAFVTYRNEIENNLTKRAGLSWDNEADRPAIKGLREESNREAAKTHSDGPAAHDWANQFLAVDGIIEGLVRPRDERYFGMMKENAARSLRKDPGGRAGKNSALDIRGREFCESVAKAVEALLYIQPPKKPRGR